MQCSWFYCLCYQTARSALQQQQQCFHPVLECWRGIESLVGVGIAHDSRTRSKEKMRERVRERDWNQEKKKKEEEEDHHQLFVRCQKIFRRQIPPFLLSVLSRSSPFVRCRLSTLAVSFPTSSFCSSTISVLITDLLPPFSRSLRPWCPGPSIRPNARDESFLLEKREGHFGGEREGGGREREWERERAQSDWRPYMILLSTVGALRASDWRRKQHKKQQQHPHLMRRPKTKPRRSRWNSFRFDFGQKFLFYFWSKAESLWRESNSGKPRVVLSIDCPNAILGGSPDARVVIGHRWSASTSTSATTTATASSIRKKTGTKTGLAGSGTGSIPASRWRRRPSWRRPLLWLTTPFVATVPSEQITSRDNNIRSTHSTARAQSPLI